MSRARTRWIRFDLRYVPAHRLVPHAEAMSTTYTVNRGIVHMSDRRISCSVVDVDVVIPQQSTYSDKEQGEHD